VRARKQAGRRLPSTLSTIDLWLLSMYWDDQGHGVPPGTFSAGPTQFMADNFQNLNNHFFTILGYSANRGAFRGLDATLNNYKGKIFTGSGGMSKKALHAAVKKAVETNSGEDELFNPIRRVFQVFDCLNNPDVTGSLDVTRERLQALSIAVSNTLQGMANVGRIKRLHDQAYCQ